MAHPGAMKDVKDIDPEAAGYANSVRAEVEGKAGAPFTVYEPVKYATQVFISLCICFQISSLTISLW